VTIVPSCHGARSPLDGLPLQAAADRAADELAAKLGKMLRDGRTRGRWTKAEVGARAGLSRSTWSDLEVRRSGAFTMSTWCRAAFAVGTDLDAFIRRASAADLPRDAVHLRNQELLIRTSQPGGWQALPEEPIDREARTSRAGDVLLVRRLAAQQPDYGLFEIFDWFDDVGGSVRDWRRRLDALERYAIGRMADDELPRTGGCWIVRATQRNRRLVDEHRGFFLSLFPGSGHAWIEALTGRPHMPAEPALLWVSVDGKRLFPARLRRS
jgi:transcriptional regulator with XRE-family HTH domain